MKDVVLAWDFLFSGVLQLEASPKAISIPLSPLETIYKATMHRKARKAKTTETPYVIL